jgi:hypothetical protein
VFLGHSNLAMLCMRESRTEAAGSELLRDLLGMHRFEWPDEDEGEVEFAIPHGEMVRLLRGSGFDVEDLVEIRAPEGATTRFEYVSPEWARRWPSEEVWKARKFR